ncbi:ferredoxin reductase [Amnibacterium sp.]|uniref:ferredoxin reductase n=1 Tax=Amnibacterium sp. TaxID=1872496 RepID=UPI002609E147|nr:ferredoxin reductase [Amnibacterium sp.]MCU1473047.1 oxidoreductase [Amnibacterium sp.]
MAAIRPETPTARTLVLDAPELGSTVAGQHIDIRLTAEDGYTAQRSYSLASATGARPVEVTVERFEDGEVSPYLVEDVGIGDPLEIRGPIGGWFVWRREQEEPVQLVAGGSGIVPLMGMIRTHAAVGSTAPFRLLYGVQDPDRRYYRDELVRLVGPGLRVDVRYSRRAPDGLPVGRIGAAELATLALSPEQQPTIYVCGPTGFVEAIADGLLRLGHAPERIRTERFGPTG